MTLAALALALALAMLACVAAAPAPAFRQLIFDQTAFPAVRPKTPKFRTINEVVSKKVAYTTFGALNINVAHLPLKKVNARDMACFWRNQEGVMPDGTPIYLLWHPVDHVDFQTSAALDTPPVAGTTFQIIEFFLTGCSPAPLVTTPTKSYTCPRSQQGFVQSSDPALWSSWPQLNGTFRVTSWSDQSSKFSKNGIGGLTFVLDLTLQTQLGPQVIPAAITVSQTWMDDRFRGLRINTNVLVGLNNANGQTPVPALGGITLNNVIVQIFANGEDPTAAAYRQILHYIQEYGNLENVIPWLKFARICPLI